MGRFALGLPVVVILTSGALVGTPTSAPIRSESASPGIERVVVDDRPARTGNATIAVNRPPAPVGDPERAIDTATMIEIAGPIATAEDPDPLPTPDGWFLVGDSTFTAAARHLGGGSAFPGVGFELAPFVGRPNPLSPPPSDFTGIVVIGVSIWDTAIEDADAYVDAVARYRAEGLRVLVVEVPEQFGPGADVVTTETERRELHALNRMVESALGCDLAPWTVRDVETSGDVDGGDDHVHPTATGVVQLVDNLIAAADHICRPAPPGELA